MPHIILEYSANLRQIVDFNKLFLDLHFLLHEHGDIAIKNCKSRALKLDDYLLADGKEEHGFVHLTIRIFAGRSSDLKKKISEQIRDLLLRYFNQPGTEITVEIVDIDRESYVKHP